MQKIAGKLVKVMADCAYIPKNGNNDFHKYSYATAAAVLEKVNASLVKHGLGYKEIETSQISVKTKKKPARLMIVWSALLSERINSFILSTVFWDPSLSTSGQRKL